MAFGFRASTQYYRTLTSSELPGSRRGHARLRGPALGVAGSNCFRKPLRVCAEARHDNTHAKEGANGLWTLFKALAATKASVARNTAAKTSHVPQAMSPHAEGSRSDPAQSVIAHATPTLNIGRVDAASQTTPDSFTLTHTSTDSHTDPMQPQQYLTVTDALLEAALWMDELRHLQAYRTQLATDVQQLSDRRASQLASSQASQPNSTSTAGTASDPKSETAAADAFVSTGPEFCVLTCQVEADAEVEEVRKALRNQIRTLSSHLMAICASNKDSLRTLRSPSPSQPPVQLQFMDRVLDPNATQQAVNDSLGHRQVKSLKKQWTSTAQEVTYLLVRLVQLRQLPAQPKARVTVAYVKEQVLNYLRERQAYLAQDSP